MKWTKPPARNKDGKPTPSAAWYLDGPDGWRLCKALVNGTPIYTLSHKGVLVFTGSREECEERAG